MWFDHHWRACVFSCMVFAKWKSVCTFTARLLDCYSGRTAYLARFRSILKIQVGLSALGRGELPSTSCLPIGSAWRPRQAEWLKKQIGEFPHFQCSRKNQPSRLSVHWLWSVVPFTTILLDFPDLSRKGNLGYRKVCNASKIPNEPLNFLPSKFTLNHLGLEGTMNPKIWASRTKYT